MSRLTFSTLRAHRRLTAALTSLIAATGVVVTLSTVASADDTPPTTMELLEQCNNGTDLCEFHVSGTPRAYMAPQEIVAYRPNCTATDQVSSVGVTHTTSSSNSLGVSMSVGGSLEGAEVALSTSIKVSYGHEWTSSYTQTTTKQITVPGGNLGVIYAAQQMEEINGQYEMHFGSRFHGHYYWYLPMTLQEPVPGDNGAGITDDHHQMTDEERASNGC